MLFKSLAVAASALLLLSVSAHQAFEPDQLSLLTKEEVPGLEAYGMESHPDLPLALTQEFFFDQIANKDDYSFRRDSSIFGQEIDGKMQPANWVLWFTAEDNPRYTCRTCTKLVEPMAGAAQHFQVEHPEKNYRVGKVNCVGQDQHLICDFLELRSLPRVVVIRPDLGQYYFMWYGNNNLYNTDDIVDFASSQYTQAFTSGELPLLRKHDMMSFQQGFWIFMRRTYQVMLEENYSQMHEMGLVGHPAQSYTLVTIGALATFLTPFFAMMMVYFGYKYYKQSLQKAEEARKKLEGDPDFEPEPSEFDDAPADEGSKKDN